jgi:hypothetical protein
VNLWNTRKVLLIGKDGYSGTGATLDQVNAIFKASKIQVVLLTDLNKEGCTH